MAIKPVFLPVYDAQQKGGSGQDDAKDPSRLKSVEELDVKSMLPTTLFPDLEEVARILRLEKYQRRRCRQLQGELKRLQIATARTARLVQATDLTLQTLAECVRCEDKSSFTNLFNAFRNAIDKAGGPPQDFLDEGRPEPTFLDQLPKPSQDMLIDVIQEVRSNGDFLADRLAFLNQKEILALLPDRGLAKSTGSVFESSASSWIRASRQIGFAVDSQIDSLATQCYGSPLETLIYSSRGFSGTSFFVESQSLDVWSTVSARLLLEKRPCSDSLVLAVLDTWAAGGPWTGQAKLELWLLQTLQAGAFLLDQPSKQSFQVRMQPRSGVLHEDEVRAEAFYAQAVLRLLEVISQDIDDMLIPKPALAMVHAIKGKMPATGTHHHDLACFIISRWLLSSYLSEAIVLPEARGMLRDHYISNVTRFRILREIATRAKNTVLEIVQPWKHCYGASPDPAATLIVKALIDRLQNSCEYDPMPVQGPRVDSFLALTANDCTTMLHALYPRHRPSSISSTLMRSSASSVSGLSLFQAPALSAGAMNAECQDMPSFVSPINTGVFATSPMPSGSDLLTTPLQADRFVHLDPETIWNICAQIDDCESRTTQDSQRWAILAMTPEQSRTVLSWNSTPVAGWDDASSQDPVLETTDRTLSTLLDDAFSQGHSMPEQDGRNSQEYHIAVFVHLERILESAYKAAYDIADFLTAQYKLQELYEFRELYASDSNLGLLGMKLSDLMDNASIRLDEHGAAAQSRDRWMRLVRSSLDSFNAKLQVGGRQADALRVQMWFVADVRTSGPYDEAKAIASALRIMGKARKLAPTRDVPTLRHSGVLKPSATSQLKMESQILELLSAPPEQGGPNKLSDDMARGTLAWMKANNIENLCRGEERLHKFCMDLRKCVDQITAGDGTFLASNPLFERESYMLGPGTNLTPRLQHISSRYEKLTLRTNVTPSIGTMSGSSNYLSSVSSREWLDSQSPTLTHRSSAPFWSPAMTEAQSATTATSVGSPRTHLAHSSPRMQMPRAGAGKGMIKALRQSLVGLLLSDLASDLFHDGSETDQAMWTGIGGELAEKHVQQSRGAFIAEDHLADPTDFRPMPRFDYENTFRHMLHDFAASNNPSRKLAVLHTVNELLPGYMAGIGTAAKHSMILRVKKLHDPRLAGPNDDKRIEGFRQLFRDAELRPAAIFRDLQYIASLVPDVTVESSPAGKAFCNAFVAASSLKQDILRVMVETADSIIAHNSNNRGHGQGDSIKQQQRDSATFSVPSRTSSAEEVARYGMAGAAHLLLVTAKEGDPVAQRELATLYLTHPELLDHTLAPFTRPRDVFRQELESKWKKNEDPSRCDPATMCVAHHWMSLSAEGGDLLAAEYLRQREEMEKLP
ncbi:hypothetical protein LTR86_003638 [Recurvomyces mirabilis]|nr:hypothetical protein LTR86_003638 [Recurvomyces mirabilis]